MELGGFLIKFWSISDQFWSKSRRFWDFEQFQQISADFDRFLHILAHPRRPPPATRARPRPAAAAGGRTLEKARKTNDFSMFREVQAVPAGLGPPAISAVRGRFLREICRFLQISAHFCIFLYISERKFARFWLIFGHFRQIPWISSFDHFWWIN